MGRRGPPSPPLRPRNAIQACAALPARISAGCSRDPAAGVRAIWQRNCASARVPVLTQLGQVQHTGKKWSQARFLARDAKVGSVIECRKGDFDELGDEFPVLCLLCQVRRLQNLLNGKEAGRVLCRGTGQLRFFPKLVG